ncbi:MAG: polysaccharide deacetylase family protein [Planctomycetota bacterium]
MSGTILCGYDVESVGRGTMGFLEGAAALHEELGVPWTIYLTGQTVEACGDAIRPMVDDPRLTVGQHTYSHMLLKSVYMAPGDGKPVHGTCPNHFQKGGTLEEIRDQIAKTQALIRDVLGVASCGMTGPWGYYRGLVDRPDILQILADNGIRWIRANARDCRDCQPTPFTEQPFFYADQGFPDILELGVQGYQDDFYWDRFDDRRHGDTYQDYLFATLKEVAANDWVWSVCSHDHKTPTREAFDATKGRWLRDFLVRAVETGCRIIAPETLYDEMRASGGDKA